MEYFSPFIDTARATIHLGILSTTEGQIAAEQQVIARWNREAEAAGWDVRPQQFGPILPAVPYAWNGRDFAPAAAHVQERWREIGLKPPPPFELRLHHESAKNSKGELVSARQGPIISKPILDGWALEYRPIGGIRFVGDTNTIKLKRGTWLSDTFVLLWLMGEAPRRITRSEASGHWWQRLRKNKLGKFWHQFDHLQEPTYLERFGRQEHIRCDRRCSWKLADDRQGKKEPIKSWRIRWSFFDAKPLNAYRTPYRPSFWNVKDYSHPVRLRLKSGKLVNEFGQYAADPAWPTCITALGQAYYLARWAELKPPAEQRILEDCKRLYREHVWSSHKRDLAQREHFSVWIDKSAQRADGRKVKKRDPEETLDVIEWLDDRREKQEAVKVKPPYWSPLVTPQEWLRRYPNDSTAKWKAAAEDAVRSSAYHYTHGGLLPVLRSGTHGFYTDTKEIAA